MKAVKPQHQTTCCVLHARACAYKYIAQSACAGHMICTCIVCCVHGLIMAEAHAEECLIKKPNSKSVVWNYFGVKANEHSIILPEEEERPICRTCKKSCTSQGWQYFKSANSPERSPFRSTSLLSHINKVPANLT